MRILIESGIIVCGIVLIAAAAERQPGRNVAGRNDPAGYVLTAGEGERVLGNIVVKASPLTGSHRAAMFTQTLAPNSQIGLHYHGRVDEFFFIHAGTGTAVLGETRVPVASGDAIFVPQGVDHKLENFESDNPLELVFFVSEPGLDALFREVHARQASSPEPLTLEELNEIAVRHGDFYKESRPRSSR